MARIIFLLLLIGWAVAEAMAQPRFVPTVIALYPNEIKADSVCATELKQYEQTGVVTYQLRKEFVRDGLAPNWKIIRERELDFIDQQDFWSLLILSITRELTYKEIENRPDLLIYPVKQTSINTLPACKKIADQNRISWVINVTRVSVAAEAEKRILTVGIQLYNVVTNRIYLDKVYTIDSTALTQPENCPDAWLCMAEVIKQAAVVDLADKIEKNIRHEKVR